MAKNSFAATKSNGLTNVSSRPRNRRVRYALGGPALVQIAGSQPRRKLAFGTTTPFPSSIQTLKSLSNGQGAEYPMGEQRIRTTRDGSQGLAKK